MLLYYSSQAIEIISPREALLQRFERKEMVFQLVGGADRIFDLDMEVGGQDLAICGMTAMFFQSKPFCEVLKDGDVNHLISGQRIQGDKIRLVLLSDVQNWTGFAADTTYSQVCIRVMYDQAFVREPERNFCSDITYDYVEQLKLELKRLALCMA